MKLQSLNQINGTDRDVDTPEWRSRRLLLAGDGMGFSLHVTTIKAGTDLDLHYQNHLEAVYCVKGKATVLDKATNERHNVTPGTVYALDQHDEHRLSIVEDCEFVCVFNPPVTGQEVHDESGAYPAASESITANA